MKYIVYDKTGKILRSVQCPPTLAELQCKEDEFIMEGTANDIIQKIVSGKVVNKTPEEIERDNPSLFQSLPFERKPAIVTNKQWQGILSRIKKLEERNHV